MPNNEKGDYSETLAEMLSQHGVDYHSENAQIETVLETVCYNMHKVKDNETVFQGQMKHIFEKFIEFKNLTH